MSLLLLSPKKGLKMDGWKEFRHIGLILFPFFLYSEEPLSLSLQGGPECRCDIHPHCVKKRRKKRRKLGLEKIYILLEEEGRKKERERKTEGERREREEKRRFVCAPGTLTERESPGARISLIFLF